MAAECHVVPHVNLKMVRRLIHISSITNGSTLMKVEETLHVELLRNKYKYSYFTQSGINTNAISIQFYQQHLEHL